MLADPHAQEAERLKTLRAYEILDTSPEIEFDEIAALASRITECPVAQVSLIDENRQWLKSALGYDVVELPRSMAICAHAILTNDFLEIHDLSQDPRTKDNPLVCAGPAARFYAGALLIAPNGLPIGTLCVLDFVPRTLTALQRDTLRVLSRQVMMRLEYRRALAAADLMRREIDHRTKNSLQSVSSLIRLQRRAAQADETRAALDKALFQIESVASLHAELFRGGGDDHIDLASLTTRLARLIEPQLPPGVRIRLDVAPYEIDSRRAAGFGVLLNEFVSNSIKHAFPNGESGEITVAATPQADGSCHIRLSDNGCGFAFGTPENLGMNVLRGAARGLGADHIEMTAENGVTLSLTIPKKITA